MIRERLHNMWLRLKALLKRRQLDGNLAEELEFHLAMREENLIKQGMSPDDARYAARREFGNVASLKESTRDLWSFPSLESFGHDVRYGLRQLRRNPGFTIVAVLTLAIGIGSSATMFNALEAVAFFHPHVKNLDRIAYITATNRTTGWSRSPLSVPGYYDLVDQNHPFEGLAAYTADTSTLTGIREPVRVSVQQVSANFFQILGVAPALGRAFQQSEDALGAGAVVVLSHHLWGQSFSSRRNILGQTVRIDDEPMTIVGVMPAGFGFPTPETDLWIPLTIDPARSPRTYRYLSVIGLLKANVSAKQAQEEMNLIARRLETEQPATERGWGVRVNLARDQMMKKFGLGLAFLLGPSICVLLIVCANLAGLLFARATTRQREIAVRAALGGGRVRLLRQLLTENLMVSLAGGATGIVLAYWGIRLIRLIIPAGVPEYQRQALHMNLVVLGFILIVSLLAPLLFGLVPALGASRPDLVEALKESGQKLTLLKRGLSFRDAIVAIEVTLAMVLLTTVSVWTKAMVKLERVNAGFDPHNLLTVQLSPPQSSYSSDERLRTFYDQVLARVSGVPGIKAVGITSLLPASGGEQSSLTQVSLNMNSEPGTGQQTTVVEQSVSSDYFKAMGIPLESGRYFTSEDSPGAPPVALVSQTMAARFWKDEDALGQRFRLDGAAANNPWVTVVGVVGDVMRDRRLGPPFPYVYLPYAQRPTRDAAVVVRTLEQPTGSVLVLRSAIQSVDKNLPLGEVMTMEQILSLEGSYFMIGLVALFACLALVLAAVGVYGVSSYMANSRIHEIGIRMALGAKRRDILWLVARQGATFVLAGAGLGVFGAVAASLFLRSQVAGVSAADPGALSLSALVLAGTAILAAYIPARRASKVDPMVALRYE